MTTDIQEKTSTRWKSANASPLGGNPQDGKEGFLAQRYFVEGITTTGLKG
jgi:hypothetical protein